jgi:predicted ATP-binding protein involved in virulence
MSKTFITDLHIDKVRHIENFDIPLSKSEMKHLIITGKNGSGKTSVLDEIQHILNDLLGRKYCSNLEDIKNRDTLLHKANATTLLSNFFGLLPYKLKAEFSQKLLFVEEKAHLRDYVILYFKARRASDFIAPKGAEKINLPFDHSIVPEEGKKFIQFMVNRYFQQVMAAQDNDKNEADNIKRWFDRIQQALRKLLDAPDAELKFDKANFNFDIIHSGREKYNFNQLSDGYSSVINLVSELIMRMEGQSRSSYDLEGVALIDEIETHLHVDLQKKILPFLISFFPNIQFIVTTHSPFVINSIKNAVICDLEKRIVTQDLSGYSYGTLVESYFGNDNYSDQLKRDLAEYERLMKSEALTVDEEERMQDLEINLTQLPKYWAPELDFKLKQIQLEKADRESA